MFWLNEFGTGVALDLFKDNNCGVVSVGLAVLTEIYLAAAI